MKYFLVLLFVGLASCDISCPPVLADDPCAIKGSYLGSSIGSGLGSGIVSGPSSSSILGCPEISGAYPAGAYPAGAYAAAGIPPAIASDASIAGLGGAYSGIYPGAVSSGLSSAYPAGDISPFSYAPALCARHHIVNRVRPVLDECVSNVPVVKNYIRNQEETFTRHVPVVTKHVSTKEEKRVRHIPVLRKNTRTVIEHQTQHVPIVKSRVVPVVQHYTQHVPVTRQYTRPVVEEHLTHVPVVERRCRPVVHKSVTHVPVTEKRYRPVVESKVINVPIKQKVVRNLVEQRIQKTCEPCQPYEYPQYFDSIGAASFPSVGSVYSHGSSLSPLLSQSVPSALITDAKVTTGTHAHSGCTCICKN